MWKCGVCGYICKFDGGEMPADFVCLPCDEDATFFAHVEG